MDTSITGSSALTPAGVVQLQVWDTPSRVNCVKNTAAFYFAIDCVIVVYDVTSEASFGLVEGWLADIQEKAPRFAVSLVVGNKADADPDASEGDPRAITTEQGQEWCDAVGVPFLEVSAKDDVGVEGVFVVAVCEIMKAKVREAESTREWLRERGIGFAEGASLDELKTLETEERRAVERKEAAAAAAAALAAAEEEEAGEEEGDCDGDGDGGAAADDDDDNDDCPDALAGAEDHLPTTRAAAHSVASVGLGDFEVVRSLGRGAFGSVSLARRRGTGEFFAIKTPPITP